MTNYNERLDEILYRLYNNAYIESNKPVSLNENVVHITNAKQALIDWHNKQVLAIIGENEPVSDNIYNTPEGVEYYINQERHKAYRNELREQQRNKLKER